MLKAAILTSALCLGLATPSLAAKPLQLQRDDHVVVSSGNPAFRADVVEVETHRSTGAIVAGDALGGAIAGAAVGGGVALYNRYVSSDKSWGDWQRDLAIGAGVGLAVGLVFGIVDASTQSSGPTYVAPVADQRESGFAPPTAAYAGRW